MGAGLTAGLDSERDSCLLSGICCVGPDCDALYLVGHVRQKECVAVGEGDLERLAVAKVGALSHIIDVADFGEGDLCLAGYVCIENEAGDGGGADDVAENFQLVDGRAVGRNGLDGLAGAGPGQDASDAFAHGGFIAFGAVVEVLGHR